MNWRIVPDLLAFALGLGLTWLQGWTTTDLVWSLWLSSLVLGYLTILSTIGAGIYIVGAGALSQTNVDTRELLRAVLIGLGLALAFLAFFSFHFCAFHAAHAGFLSSFFPLPGLPKNAFFGAFMNPVRLWTTAVQHLLPVYGIFLFATAIAERNYLFAPLIGAAKVVREGIGATLVDRFKQSASGQKNSFGNPFARPYINVIRMHLLIFFFFFCHALKIESFLVFVVVYCVYFFPWHAFKSAPLAAGTPDAAVARTSD
jgi:hypothetical protein